MFLREHDGKEVLRRAGIPTPPGIVLDAPITGHSRPPPPPGPAPEGWMVKAQVPAGGRGKMGGIRPARDWPAALDEARAMLGRLLGPHNVAAVRIEARVAHAHEAYLSLSIAPAERRVRIMAAAQGGIDIEALHAAGQVRTLLADPTAPALADACRALAEPVPDIGPTLAAAAAALAAVFLSHRLVLLEINPLFILPGGGWVAGDAKLLTDDNALDADPVLQSLLEANHPAYPVPYLKWRHGFDYLVLDRSGEVGLVTTGAGLSMMLVDQLRDRGIRPYNFLDVRTGGMNGSPERLVQVLRWIAEGRQVRALLCNIFAGATDLAEFARLLLAAREAVPQLRAPMVVRLVGNGLVGAQAVLAAAGVAVTTDLEEAIAAVAAALDHAPGPTRV